MRNLRAAGLVLAVAVGCGAPSEEGDEPLSETSDYSTQPPLTLAGDGTSAPKILYWTSEPDEAAIRHASGELRAYLNRMGATPFPLPTRIACTQPKLKSGIVLVTSALSASASPSTMCGWFGEGESNVNGEVGTVADAYGIDTLPKAGTIDRLLIAGNSTAGALYAVYDVVQRLGARFYAPSFSFYGSNGRDFSKEIPRVSGPLTLPATHVREAPAMAYRKKDLANNRSHNANTARQLLEWMAQSRMNVLQFRALYANNYIQGKCASGTSGALCTTTKSYVGCAVGDATCATQIYESIESAYDAFRSYVYTDTGRTFVEEAKLRGILLEVGGHGYQRWLPEAAYKELFPEWFEAGANVFNVSNPNARREYIKNVVQYLEAHSEIDIFDAWPPDAAVWSKADMTAFGGNPHNAEATLLNELRDEMDKRATIRHIKLETLAYASASPAFPGGLGPPDAAHMYRSSILVDVACIGRNYAERIYEGENLNQCAWVRGAWLANGFQGEMGIYEYYRRQAFHSLPVLLLKLIGGSPTKRSEMREYVKQGYKGLGFYAEAGDWLAYESVEYLAARGIWGGKYDHSSVVTQYIRDRFSDAASADMTSYFDHVEAGLGTFYRTFDGDTSKGTLDATLLHLYAAKDALLRARSAVSTNGPAYFIIDRLKSNLWFAIYDLEIKQYADRGDGNGSNVRKGYVRDRIVQQQFLGTVLLSGVMASMADSATPKWWNPFEGGTAPFAQSERCARCAYRNIVGRSAQCPGPSGDPADVCTAGNSGF